MNQIKAAVIEEYKAVPIMVQGSIPDWLNGTMVRNGPTDISIDGKSPKHWFDGLAMLHAFSFKNGNVVYSNRYLRTEAFNAVFNKGSLNYVGFDSDPCRSLFYKFFTMLFPFHGHALNNTNVNVGNLANQFVAYTETPLPVRFDKDTLETLGVFDYQDNLPKRNCFESAHPHRDWKAGYTYNYIVNFGRKTTYQLYRIKDGSSTREMVAEIPVEYPSYMHSFSFTQNKVIFAQYPIVANPIEFITKNKPFIENYSWKSDLKTKFLVIDRHNGTIEGTYETEPFFSFHHVNSFEDTIGNIIIDIVTYPNANIITDIGSYYDEEGRSKHEIFNTKLVRFTLNEDKKSLSSKEVFVGPIEFPRIHEEKFEGQPYRFAYATDAREPIFNNDLRPIYKINMDDGTIAKWEEEGCYPGEPIFVPRPNGEAEDAGVVMTIVIDEKNNSSFLLILDASTFKEIGRAEAPIKIPPGLHARFFN